MKSDRHTPTAGAAAPAWMQWLTWGVLGVAALLALWALGQMTGGDGEVARLATRGWPAEYAEIIVSNKIHALWHAAFMTLCAGAFLWLFLLARPAKKLVYTVAAWSLVLLVAGDAWWLSRYYVKTMPRSALEANPVIALLKKDMPVQRVALVTQDGFYNWWLTYLFPYHNIQTVNFTQMPRMPEDYRNFLTAVGRHPIRYWQLAAVGYVLTPTSVWQQFQKDPATGALFDLVYSYNVGPAEAGVAVIPATSFQPGQHAVLRFKQPGPRYALLAGWEPCADAEALRRLAAPEFVPFKRLMVAPECATNLPPATGAGVVGTVSSLGYRPGFFHLRTTAPQAAVLRVSEKFNHDWRARVDGRPAPVLRVDYLFQGVYLPAGTHEVALEYAPATGALKIQIAGLLLCLAAAGWLVFRRFRFSGPSVA